MPTATANPLPGRSAPALLDRTRLAHPAGPRGPMVAFGAEVVISFVLMVTVPTVRDSRFARFTGAIAGARTVRCIFRRGYHRTHGVRGPGAIARGPEQIGPRAMARGPE